ncbi:Nn.00g049460.m01.CDS01 [Neocucurbitaria sp. VM-36]
MPMPWNMFSKSKVSTPDNPTSNSPSMTDDQLGADWNEISHEEAAGYYTDRMILILGPTEIIHQILLADIPPSSHLLARFSHLNPSKRCIRLPFLDVNMIDFYVQTHSVDALANEFSWNEVVRLCMTAEILQDSMVESTAIAALKKKGKDLQETREVMYSHIHYQLVRTHYETTGNGLKLLQTLDDIAQAVYAGTRVAGSVSSPGFTGAVLSEGKTYRHVAGEYGDGVPREKSLSKQKGRGEKEMEYPARQRNIPPSVEALRSGTVGNVVWSKRKDIKKK